MKSIEKETDNQIAPIRTTGLAKDLLSVRCICGYIGNVPIQIEEIEQLPGGFLVKGSASCPRCAKFFQLSKTIIPVELKSLKCPSCSKDNLGLAWKKIQKTEDGYSFSAELKCTNRKCHWKNAFKSSLKSTLNSLKKIKVSVEGVEVETK
jgi:hypothetical protein